MDILLESGTKIYNKELGWFLVINQNRNSLENIIEEFPRFDIININTHEILEGCYIHNGSWDNSPINFNQTIT